MIIPKRFKLANRTWHVVFRKRMKDYGETLADDATIKLNVKLREPGREELLLHTWLHELLHAASGTMGWNEVNDDEDRIDVLAGMLAQAMTTAEGEAC